MTEDNKKIVLEHLDLSWNRGEFERIDCYLSKRFFYKTTFTDEILNLDQYMDFVTVFRQCMPGLSVDIELIMAEGNHVMTQISFMGPVVCEFYGIPASDKIITFTANSIWEINDVKIISLDTIIDMAGLGRQVGTVITPHVPLTNR